MERNRLAGQLDDSTGPGTTYLHDIYSSWTGETTEEDELKAQTPDQIHECFERALADNDIDAMMAVYEPDAVLVPEAGKTVEGADAVRRHLEEMLAMKPRLRSETTVAVRAGDIAMLRAKWTMSIPSAQGQAAEVRGESTEIVRRQRDGTWKCVIDNPFSV